MADRQTGSVWAHLDGSVLSGPLAGTGVEMEIMPLVHSTWEEWTAEHPDGLVLDWYPEFADRYRRRNPGVGPDVARAGLEVDGRLVANELVLGVDTGTAARAYPLVALPAGRTAVTDELGGEPVVILADTDAGFALAYSPVVDGRVLEFTGNGWSDTTGTEWDQTGTAVSGRLAGERLDFVTSFVTEWYGWAAYHPDTDVYPG